ncbi:cAMP-regulated D2 protein [Thecamonas trahens ATCC 50062]|uniref:cAMP-regulated D2 protein n=1 Tax=Thecamonas trahens ATCC 50062 TaxID=461836 RepID=A0A0L0DM86_THETB|nr:cAMP-regulated D2 protein [Thecamonas trahens ATCC 50062]KNC53439.1 cAMP-regulated D2 protein [Thecamonas trahens ATCC 50062]|eukprot:XP_013754474.1 cAMP-regulated D2 protein [Thecamonas trahens ATCC 50062]
MYTMYTLVISLTLILSLTSAAPPVVDAPAGRMSGVLLEATQVRAFYNIPFAEPPTGALRWMPPVAKGVWNGTMALGESKAIGCPQRCFLPPHTCPTTTSEACLTLNVFAPVAASNAPVMIFMPGGHFQQGLADVPVYNGQYLANATGVVVVTINYRLGALGWLVTDELEGNFGFLDQQLALKWVADNVAAFGGNPSRRTLMGQSAGAGSLAAHLIAPSSAPLFEQAVVMSSTIGLAISNPKYGAQLGALVMANMSCKTTECMRGKPVASVLEAEYASQSHLFVDHPLSVFLPWNVNKAGPVPDNQLTAMRAGKVQRKPMIMGNVANEGVIFIYDAVQHPLSKTEYEAIVAGVFGLHAPRVLDLFPGNVIDSRVPMSHLATYYVMICPQRYAMEAMAQNAPVYAYLFDHPWSFARSGWGANYTFCFHQVCHGSGLPFMFSVVRGPQPELGAIRPIGCLAPASRSSSSEGGIHPVDNFAATACDYFDSIGSIGYQHGEGKLDAFLPDSIHTA